MARLCITHNFLSISVCIEKYMYAYNKKMPIPYTHGLSTYGSDTYYLFNSDFKTRYLCDLFDNILGDCSFYKSHQ